MGNRWKKQDRDWNFTLIVIICVAVKSCGKFIMTGKSVLYVNFKSSREVKRKWPSGGRLWILFESIWLKIKVIVCIIIVTWNCYSPTGNQLWNSGCQCKFLVALATRKAQFQTLLYLSGVVPCKPFRRWNIKWASLKTNGLAFSITLPNKMHGMPLGFTFTCFSCQRFPCRFCHTWRLIWTIFNSFSQVPGCSVELRTKQWHTVKGGRPSLHISQGAH